MRNKLMAGVFILAPLLANAQHDSSNAVTKLLQLSLEELMNVKVVTASGYLQNTTDAPSTITVISAQKIAERGYEQLEDALRDIPGIDMIHVNGYVPTLIYFRGSYGAENQRALLMIDGIPENNIIGSNDMAGPAYSLHNIERIEIIWGPVSALYGANAFGGVINMITKKGHDLNGLHAEKGFGSFNTSITNIDLGMRKGKFEFNAAGSLFSTDGPKFSNRDPDYAGSYVDKAYSFNGSMSYYSNRSTTTLGLRTYRTPMGWGTYSNSPTVYLGLPAQGNGNLGIVGVAARDLRGEKSGLDDAFLRTVFLQNDFKVTDKWDIFSRIVYRETGTADDSYIYVTADGTKLIRARIATFSNRLSYEASGNFAPSQNHHFSAGLQFFQDNVEKGSRKSTFDPTVYLIDGRDTVINVNSTFLPRTFDIRNNFGSYIQYVANTKFLGKTNLTLGGRYDYNSYFGSSWSPRIAIVNQPTDKLTFKLQFGTAFRAPTNLEIYQTGLNFSLTTEKIRTYELNAIYAMSKKLRFQVNAYQNRLTDVIILANLSGFNPDKNPGIINVRGIEAVADVDISSAFSAFANVTFQHATGVNLVTMNSGNVSGIAHEKGNFGVAPHLGDLFTVSFINNWVGQRKTPRTDPYGPVAGYFLSNLVISTAELFNKGITASFEVRNLFNTKWLDPGFRTADGLVYSTVLEQPGINGLFKIGIRL